MTDIEQAIVAAYKEMVAAELQYCRATVLHCEFIIRHTAEEDAVARWVATYNAVVEHYTQAQARAVELGMEAGEPLQKRTTK